MKVLFAPRQPDVILEIARAEELHELEPGGGAEELPAHSPGQPEVEVRVRRGGIELRGVRSGDDQLESSRRHRAGDLENHVRLAGREKDLHCCASGTVAVTQGWLPCPPGG